MKNINNKINNKFHIFKGLNLKNNTKSLYFLWLVWLHYTNMRLSFPDLQHKFSKHYCSVLLVTF